MPASLKTPSPRGRTPRGRWSHPWALVLLAVIGAQGGCQGPPERPNVVIVVVDTLRPDRLGVYGYTRPTSPRIDSFASTATTFENASAPSSWTKPSVGSLFTSRYPSSHGARSYGTGLTPEIPTLAELLRAQGYATIGVSANFVHLTAQSGFDRGFDTWETASTPAAGDGEEAAPARRVNQRALEHLDANPTRPFFLYLQYMEPHTPLRPAAPVRRQFARSASRPASASTEQVLELAAKRRLPQNGEREWLSDLYDAEVATADAAFGDLLAALDERGLLANTLVVLTSDHGEAFGEHDSFFHGQTLYGELLRVPLLVRFPGQRAPRRRADPVDLLDVATTVLATTRTPEAPSMLGRALQGPIEPRILRAELYPESGVEAVAGPRRHRVAVAAGAFKTIVDYTRRAETFRLDQDPGETKPLPPNTEPAALKEAVVGAIDALANSAPTGTRELAPSEAEALRSLGYLD